MRDVGGSGGTGGGTGMRLPIPGGIGGKGGIGGLILVIALVVLGPKKLPDLGRSLGGGMREFKNSITGGGERDELPATDPSAVPKT